MRQAILLLVVYAAGISAQTFSFSPAPGSPLTATNSILCVVPADFNKDGHTDLVVGNSYNSQLHVYIGSSTGQLTLAPGSPLIVNSGPQAAAVADFNGDGDLDIATANYSSANLSILLGNGTGSFVASAGSPISTASQPYAIQAADFNLDGEIDIISTALNAGGIYLHHGLGNGSFTLASGFPKAAGGTPYDVAAGMLNNDIYPDFAVISHSPALVSIWLGSSSGVFSLAPGSPVTVANGPRTMRLKDLNWDGNIDIVVSVSTGNAVHVLLGSATGSFSTAPGSPLNLGMQTFMSAIADFNGDGEQDVAVTSQSGKVLFLKGTGTGSFSVVSLTLSLGLSAHPVTAADFDQNGSMDLAVGDFIGNKVYVMLNNLCQLSGAITHSWNPDGSVQFTAAGSNTSASTTYSWSFPGNTGAVGATSAHTFSPGVHTVTLTLKSNLSDNCKDITTATFTVPTCPLAAAVVHSVGKDGLVSFAAAATGTNANTTYHWQFGAAATATGSSVSYSFTPGTYVVTVTVNNNSSGPPCFVTYTTTVQISDGTVGIKDLNSDVLKNVFPNPATEQLFIRCREIPGKFLLFDESGKHLLSVDLNEPDEQISIKHLPEGVYSFLSISDNSPVQSGRILIKR